MRYKGSGITSPAQWRGKIVGVTDLGRLHERVPPGPFEVIR